jgi:hypothetical protein
LANQIYSLKTLAHQWVKWIEKAVARVHFMDAVDAYDCRIAPINRAYQSRLSIAPINRTYQKFKPYPVCPMLFVS